MEMKLVPVRRSSLQELEIGPVKYPMHLEGLNLISVKVGQDFIFLEAWSEACPHLTSLRRRWCLRRRSLPTYPR